MNQTNNKMSAKGTRVWSVCLRVVLAGLLAAVALQGLAPACQDKQDQNKQDPPKQEDKGDQKQDKPKQGDPKQQDDTSNGDSQGDDKSKDDDAAKAKRQEQLNKDLFKDLGGDLFDTIGDKKSENQEQEDPGKDLFDDLGNADGEDIGADGDPLVRIGQRMRKVENLLKEANSGQSTQELQQQIAADLARLIAQAEQQQQQSQSSQQQDQNSSQSGNPQQGSGQPQPGQATQNQQRSMVQSQTPGQAPQDSTDGPRPPAGPDSASMAAIRDLMEKTPWGDLPERIRQTMLQSPTEQMLPEYAEQIRRYFERLAKRNGS